MLELLKEVYSILVIFFVHHNNEDDAKMLAESIIISMCVAFGKNYELYHYSDEGKVLTKTTIKCTTEVI